MFIIRVQFNITFLLKTNHVLKGICVFAKTHSRRNFFSSFGIFHDCTKLICTKTKENNIQLNKINNYSKIIQ